MRRKKRIIWLLCAAVSPFTYSTAAGNLPETSRKEIENPIESQIESQIENQIIEDTGTGQPAFIIIEQPFLSLEDMEPDEERSQVFSIWNTETEEKVYYFTMQAPEEITWELTKAGEPYAGGQALGTPVKLVKLQPDEHMVFWLTVKNTGDAIYTATPLFFGE